MLRSDYVSLWLNANFLLLAMSLIMDILIYVLKYVYSCAFTGKHCSTVLYTDQALVQIYSNMQGSNRKPRNEPDKYILHGILPLIKRVRLCVS